MSDNHERGAYSPQSDAPLAFDARRSSGGGGGGGFPTTLVVSVGILAVLIVAIVLFYRSGVRGAGQGPAPVGAPVAQIKTPAPAEAQSSDGATGLQIYKTESGAPAAAPAFSAPPEQPQPRPVAAAPVYAVPTPPPSPAVVAATGATGPARPAPAQAVAAAPAPQTKDQIGELLDKSPAASKPVAKPVAATPVSAKPVAVTPAAVVAGAASAQIGAYSSQALGAKGWSDIAKAFPADMHGKGQHFEPVAKDGATLYRTAVTGFASKADAVAFCAKLKAAGHACIVK